VKYKNGDIVNSKTKHNWKKVSTLMAHGEYCQQCYGLKNWSDIGGHDNYTGSNEIEEKKKPSYATGGLNTKTGPAWLDGTFSKPELVLNARDTENFIQLKDHLATLR
jgi:hypothetical protein